MPNKVFRKYLIKVSVFLYFSFFLSYGHPNNESNERSGLISEANVWLQNALETDAANFEVVPPDHRVRILPCTEKLLFDFPFNGKETIRAKCPDPTWQFFLRVKTDNPEIKNLLSPVRQTKKKKNHDTAITDVLFARKNLSVGSILRENDTETKSVKKNTLPVDFYSTFEGLENYEVVKNIKAGSVIRSLNLRPARLVKRGTKVQLKILAQGMLVTATVEALEDGHIGQQIKLMNNASGKTVTGVVTGLNEVSGL
ncbi:MAG: flagella basal body P-ring formation protein FlgA [Proteobacteria bacterium]|nr:flagella basal body P-ring formation protein FlgA [Pseudomonadota bacterium]|tara:strand:+ start:724 stop:1488 length:765 start_codon:yes stop_codon:yes gene_type:complete